MSLSSSTNDDSSLQMRRNRKWMFRLIVLLCLLILLIITYRFVHTFFFKKDNSVALPPKPVAISSVKNMDVPIVYTELGTVVPVTTIIVPARIAGYLQQVFFTEGQSVKKGELLALIDPRPYELLKAQYEGTLKADQATLKQAKLDNARYQKLLKQNSIAPMTAQDQQYKVAQLKGQIEADKALVNQQRLNIIYCHIRANVDGRIGIRAVDAGNYVTEGQSGGIATLTQMTPISVLLTVPENKLDKIINAISKQKTLQVEAWNSDNTKKLAVGTTSVIDSEIDTSTGTIKLRALFSNEGWGLFPNQFVNIHILVNTLHDVLTVPNNAIQTGPEGSFVYVVENDSIAKLKLVKTGYDNGERTVISSGLKRDDKVVTDGIDQLKDGSKITIAKNSSS